MKSFTLRHITAALSVVVMLAALVHAQNIVITNSAVFTGSGTLNIKGHIIDSAANEMKISGTTRLIGAGQNIGDSAQTNASLTFEGLVADSAGTKTMKIPVKVSKDLTINKGDLSVNGLTLTVDSSTAHTGAGALQASGNSDVVVYDGNGAYTQQILDATYKKLQLTNASPKVLLNPVVADTVAHSGGGLGVNHNLTVAQTGVFATIDSASATLQFTGTGTNTIATITGTAAGGTIVNASASSQLAITNVNGNAGTISTGAAGLKIDNLAANTGTIKTTGAGPIQFTNGATNNGVIADSGAGVSGGVTFGAALANQSAGKVMIGTGGATFTGVPTNAGLISADAGTAAFVDSANNSGTISLSSTAAATFAKGVKNSGSLALAGTAQGTFTQAVDNTGGTLSGINNTHVTFNQNFINAGTLAFADSNHAAFQGATNNVPAATYANLDLIGPDKTAAGNDTLTGNVLLGSYLTMPAGKSLAISSEGSLVGGAGEIVGSVSRTHAFSANKYYPFNKDSIGLGVVQNAVTPGITLTMIPDSGFSVASPSQKYVKRHYGFSGTSLAGVTLSTVSLMYADTEKSPLVTDETKLGIRADVSSSWAKISNSAGYHRHVDATKDIVLLTSLNYPLANVSELGIINTAFQTIADNQPWSTGSTWDEGSSPSITDDAEVWNNGVLVNAAGEAASLEILSGKSLNVQSNTLTIASSLNMNGTLSVQPTGTLTVQTNNLRINGPVNNSGTINVGQ